MTEKSFIYTTVFLLVFLTLCYTQDLVMVAPPKLIYISTGSTLSLSWCIADKYETYTPDVTFYFSGSGANNGDVTLAKNKENTLVVLPTPLFSTNQITVMKYSACRQNGRNYTIILRNLSNSQAGIYKIEADYISGLFATKNNTKVIFFVPPSIALNSSKIVNIGDDVTLVCNASGIPTPTIQWSKHGGDIVLSDDPVWIISKSITKEQNGTYKCTADDGRGNIVSKIIDLVVYYPPVVETLSGSRKSFIGEKESLQCFAGGNPVPSYNWILPKQSEQTINKDNNILEITFISSKDFGNYTCVAKNIVGETQKRIIIKELFVPGVISDISNETYVHSIQLTWKEPTNNGGLPVFNYSISFTGAGKTKKDLTQSTEYEARNLLKNTSYTFCISAQNKVGFGNETCISTNTLYKGPPERPLLNAVQIISEEPVKVLISWKSVGDTNVFYVLKYHTIKSDWKSVNLTSLNYTLNNFEIGITYIISLVAVNQHGVSQPSKIEYNIPTKTVVPTTQTTTSTSKPESTGDVSIVTSIAITEVVVPSAEKSEGSNTKTIVTVISVILALLIIVAIVFFVLWMKRRSNEHRDTSVTSGVIHEIVDKSKKTDKKSGDLVYAELSEIAPIAGEHKRPAYEPTEYADIAYIMNAKSDGLYENVQSMTDQDENMYSNINEMDV